MSTPQQAPTKLLIQMSGAPGSGKSTIAKLIGPSISGVVIDHDVLRSSLIESEILSFDQAAKQAYLLQWKLAQDIMEQGLNVIIDSTCNYPQIITEGDALASKYDYLYRYVECKVRDVDLLNQRLRTRIPMLSQRTAIDGPPVAAQDSRTGEDAHVLFDKWIKSPCRPEDTTRFIQMDSTVNPTTARDQILKQIFG